MLYSIKKSYPTFPVSSCKKSFIQATGSTKIDVLHWSYEVFVGPLGLCLRTVLVFRLDFPWCVDLFLKTFPEDDLSSIE